MPINLKKEHLRVSFVPTSSWHQTIADFHVCAASSFSSHQTEFHRPSPEFPQLSFKTRHPLCLAYPSLLSSTGKFQLVLQVPDQMSILGIPFQTTRQASVLFPSALILFSNLKYFKLAVYMSCSFNCL